jgi:hypothetical protein
VHQVAAWRPGAESLIEAVEAALGLRPSGQPIPFTASDLLALEHLVQASVPLDLRRHLTEGPLVPAQLDVPGFDAWQPVVGRYLAARAFASWVGYYGSGLLTWYRSVLAAYAVLRTACARVSLSANRAFDESMMVEALGKADRLLIHMASQADLAAALDAWELER